jgi:hypothetical protein
MACEINGVNPLFCLEKPCISAGNYRELPKRRGNPKSFSMVPPPKFWQFIGHGGAVINQPRGDDLAKAEMILRRQ